MMSITQIANHFGRTRQGVYVALRSGRFSAKKEFGARWKISLADYEEYHKNRYSRKEARKSDGTLVFDKSKGIYSVIDAAEFLNKSVNWVYYRLRTHMLPSKRYKSAWLIHIDDLKKFKEEKPKNK